MRLRFVLIAFLGAASCAASLAQGGAAVSATARPILPCDEIIGNTKFPYRTSGYRAVLGAVAVPTSYLQQVVPTRSKPWAHWRKAGLVVRGGSPQITVTVPPAWRTRAAITWGNGSAGNYAASLAIARCDGPANVGHAYAGGFYLRSASACVPIAFQAGNRHATVRFWHRSTLLNGYSRARGGGRVHLEASRI